MEKREGRAWGLGDSRDPKGLQDNQGDLKTLSFFPSRAERGLRETPPPAQAPFTTAKIGVIVLEATLPFSREIQGVYPVIAYHSRPGSDRVFSPRFSLQIIMVLRVNWRERVEAVGWYMLREKRRNRVDYYA